MEENRYKKVVTMFLNRTNTIKMFEKFDNKSSNYKIDMYKSETDKWYNYMFNYTSDRVYKNMLRYKLCLNKERNLIVLCCKVNTNYRNQETNTYLIKSLIRLGITEYKHGYESGIFTIKIKINKNTELSKIFSYMDWLDKIQTIIDENHVDMLFYRGNMKDFFEDKMKG